MRLCYKLWSMLARGSFFAWKLCSYKSKGRADGCHILPLFSGHEVWNHILLGVAKECPDETEWQAFQDGGKEKKKVKPSDESKGAKRMRNCELWGKEHGIQFSRLAVEWWLSWGKAGKHLHYLLDSTYVLDLIIGVCFSFLVRTPSSFLFWYCRHSYESFSKLMGQQLNI